MKRFSIAIAVGVPVMLILWFTLTSIGNEKNSPGPSLCTNYVGPPFIVSDESESKMVFRGASPGVNVLLLDSRKVEGNIPIQNPIFATSMPRGEGVLVLALSEGDGTRISTIGIGNRQIRATAVFDGLEVQSAVFTPNGKYLVGTTMSGDVFRAALDSKSILLINNAGIATSSIAVSPTSKKLYVAGNGLTIVDVEQMTILSTIAKESRFLEVAASNDDNVLAIRNLYNIKLVNVDGLDGDKELSSVVVDDQPNAASIRSTRRLAFSADGSAVYYIKALDVNSELVVLSANDLHVQMRLPIGSHPNAIAVLPDHNWVVVMVGVVGNEQLEIIDMNTRTTILKVPLERSWNKPTCSRETMPDKAA